MHFLSNKRMRDYAGGVLMIVIGVAAAIRGSGYRMGHARAYGSRLFSDGAGRDPHADRRRHRDRRAL
jgi:hypothetical protein